MSLAEHLARPRGRGHIPPNAHTGAAGGAACGDLIRISVAVGGDCRLPGGGDSNGAAEPHSIGAVGGDCNPAVGGDCNEGAGRDRIVAAGFDARGCGSAIAAGSAAVALVEGVSLLAAARVGADEIAAELGGLSPAKRHAAELACDALHRALGAAIRRDAALPHHAGRTLVAMSGGVDSAVVALTSGPEAVGVTVELWSDPATDGEKACCSPQAVRTARALAHRLGLPHVSLDLRQEFRAGVVEPWIAEHAAGLTPNPCVRCNGSVRLDAMLALAGRLGAEALATGHYARLEDGLLRAAVDPAKDQSYVLAAVPRETLRRMRFPLGELRKEQVRAIAADAGLPVARRPDSQDLCFLAGSNRAAFLERHGGLGERPGPIVDRGGRTIGRHRGQHHHTVGQRRGLGVGGGEPLYVLAKHGDTVVAGPRTELATDRVRLRDVVIHRGDADRVMLRYRQAPLRCSFEAQPGRHDVVELRLDEPAFGVAPGQLACLMAGETVVGHGLISAQQ